MSITIRVDVIDTLKGLSALERKQIPFALSLAVNTTGLDFQKAERAHFADVFTERRKDFIEKQGVKRLGPAASKNNPTIMFGVDPRADFLNKFEPGGPRPFSGRSIAIPEDVTRRKSTDIIPARNRPRQLLDTRKRSGSRGVFLLRQKKGSLAPGIYERTGRKGRGEVILLYTLAQRAMIPASLQFEQTFVTTVNTRWAINFDAAFKQAVATAN